jgi:hypothetical protein
LTDDDGNLWVSEFRLPTEQPSWAVFDPAGQLLGVLETPGNGFVTHIGSDFLVGVWEDALEVQRVMVYQIQKTPVG